MSSRHNTDLHSGSEVRTYDLSALAEYDVRLLAQALGDHDTNRIAKTGVRDEPAFANLERFAAEVEILLDCLTPDWSGDFPIVQVSIESPAPNRTAADPFTYCNPTGAVFLHHPGIESITGVTLRYPCPGSTRFTIDLHDNDRTTRLRVELPTDARRAELVYHYDDTHLGTDDTPLVTALNQRPDADAALLHVLQDSPARIPVGRVDGLWIPACEAELENLDAAVRASGLYDLDAETHAAVARLGPTWRHQLSELRETAMALTSGRESGSSATGATCADRMWRGSVLPNSSTFA